MRLSLPFQILTLLCGALSEPEVGAATGLTKFRDLSFFNNLINFVEDTGTNTGSSPNNNNEDEEYETDLEGGVSDSIHQSSDKMTDQLAEEDDGKPPKTLMAKKGVKVEVNKQKFVSYDTEFTLSLKWRPFRTVKSIKKMLLFFPKKIEQTAFNKWELLRGGSKSAEEGGKKGKKGAKTKTNGMLEDGLTEQDLIDDDGCAWEDCDGWDDDQDDYDSDDDGQDWDGQSDSDDDDQDWLDLDEDEWDINNRDSSDNYPFFVRLSSYDGGANGTTNVTAQSILGRKKKKSKKGSKTTSDAKDSQTKGSQTKDSQANSVLENGAMSKSSQLIKRRKKRAKYRPGYVLVDSSILVNTYCPHTLDEFKSSPQQWGKQKLVVVKLYNSTTGTRRGKQAPRYFPGDRMASDGSFYASSVSKVIVSVLLVVFPFFVVN